MAKRQIKNKAPSKRWNKYNIKEGKIERKQSCPRCGPGFFLGQHKDRTYCGNCHYTNFITKIKENVQN